jgi:hypothetical protein
MREHTRKPAPTRAAPASRAAHPAAANADAVHDAIMLQRTLGNRAVGAMLANPVQRLMDGFYADGKTKVPAARISLTSAFKKKHVAADETAARSITGARIDGGKPVAMVNGTLGNTTATESDWLAAISDSTAVVPDQDAWSGGLAIKVKGWDAKRTGPRSITLTPLADAARTVGGYMKKQGGNVEIDHVAGQNG